jgi:hypothetical protein
MINDYLPLYVSYDNSPLKLHTKQQQLLSNGCMSH